MFESVSHSGPTLLESGLCDVITLITFENILESASIIRTKRAKGKKECSHHIPLCITTKPQEIAFRAQTRAINYLIDGSLAFVDDDKCQIRCPFEEDLFQKELDREIQLKWNLSGTKSF